MPRYSYHHDYSNYTVFVLLLSRSPRLEILPRGAKKNVDFIGKKWYNKNVIGNPIKSGKKGLIEMNFWVHLILAVITTAFFLFSFVREKKAYQFLFVLWVPFTLLTHLSDNRIFLYVIGGIQLVFFLLVVYFLFRNPNRKRMKYQDLMEQLDSYGRSADEPIAQPQTAEPTPAEEPAAE